MPTFSLSNIVAGNDSNVTMSLNLVNPELVNKVEFELVYDTELLDIEAIALNESLPSDWQLTNTQIDEKNGLVRLTIGGSDPLTGSNFTLTDFEVNVPDTATYGATQTIELQSVKLNDRDVDFQNNNGIHIVAQPGDISGDGNLTGLDAYQIMRLAVGLDTDFKGFIEVEHSMLADINQDGFISALDAYLAYRD